ncbi:type II secretion system minor pseudopilin GspH [Pseudomonas fragi]|uniref:type II secretion system minor pseudopilin GspH n=1 Tax=Pseudomonas fragi TaxID=296 RepID=UPI000BA1DAD6|nr:type II secretion system minor pseudopilin GspH [Pseudomonas fragi]PAA38982.1 type II secretion system protein GspH [Pseudomonas fragi]
MRRRASGFALIELLVVIVLVGVLASMVRISLGDNNSRNARQEADVLLGVMHGLREKAVLDGREYGLRLEPGAYQVMRFERDAWKPADARVNLPYGLALALTVEGRSQPLIPMAEAPQLMWLSSDENTAFSLHVDSPPRRWRSIVSDGLGDALVVVAQASHEG